MKTDYLKFLISVFFVLILIWTISCSGKPQKNQESDSQTTPVVNAEERVMVVMVSPEENSEFTLNKPVSIVLSVDNNKRIPDSVNISFDSRHVATLKSAPWEFTIPAEYTVTTGRKSIKVTPYDGNKPGKSITRFMIVYSDAVPEQNNFKVIHTFPHDRSAFTQGLIYDGGLLYEGTGQETGSTLREVELETGKVLRQHNLDASLFGEGITLFNNMIYQVTWENKVGFVYDKATFNVIKKIYYMTQGWGLTTVGDRIVMSDGSNALFFLEPESFTVISRLEVYDNTKMIDSLNELEYINGEIWANIWMTDQIARIDPESGKVNGYINLKGILRESDKNPDTDVLNGIAYDQKGKRIFVTGKRWPKLFEITITK